MGPNTLGNPAFPPHFGPNSPAPSTHILRSPGLNLVEETGVRAGSYLCSSPNPQPHCPGPPVLCLFSWAPSEAPLTCSGETYHLLSGTSQNPPQTITTPSPPSSQPFFSRVDSCVHTPTPQLRPHHPSWSFCPTLSVTCTLPIPGRPFHPHLSSVGQLARTSAEGLLWTSEKLLCGSKDRAADGLASAPAVTSWLWDRFLHHHHPPPCLSFPIYKLA